MISCMNASITGSEQLGREAKRGRPIMMPWRICSTCAARNDVDWHENCIAVWIAQFEVFLQAQPLATTAAATAA